MIIDKTISIETSRLDFPNNKVIGKEVLTCCGGMEWKNYQIQESKTKRRKQERKKPEGKGEKTLKTLNKKKKKRKMGPNLLICSGGIFGFSPAARPVVPLLLGSNNAQFEI